MSNERIHIKDFKSDLSKITVGNNDFTATFAENYLQISNQDIRKSDFEDCDFTAAQLIKVKIADCTFSESNFFNARLGGCIITDTHFKKCNFNGTALICKGTLVTEFRNCSFENCKFSSLSLDYTLFENCKFLNCSFKKIEFNGSRFSNTFFSGKISGSFFRKHIRHLPTYGFVDKIKGNTIKPSQYENEMVNIDFSKCELDDVTFVGGVNLMNCKFPEGERYLFIKNSCETYSKALEEINSTWEGEQKRLANAIFRAILTPKCAEGQLNDFIDFDITTSQINGNFSAALRKVLEKYN